MTSQGDAQSPENRTKSRKRLLKRVVRWSITVLVVAVVAFFFTRALTQNWDQVVAQDIAASPWWIVSVLFFVIAVPTTGLCWGRIVRVLAPDVRVTNAEAIAVQCLSWILKYIPGQVGSVANKVLWAKKKGISRTLVVITFIYENVFLQLASLIPGALILLVSLGPEIFGDNATLLLLPLIVVVPFALVIWKPFFHRLIAVPARRVLKQNVPSEYFLSTAQTLRSVFEFLMPRILNSIGFVILCATIADVTPAEWLPFAAAYMLAAAIGILAVFVPSGLGVREAIIVLILSQYIPVTQAIIISLLARLMSTMADIGVALIYALIRRTIPKEIRP